MKDNVRPEDISEEEQAKAFIKWKKGYFDEVEWWHLHSHKWVEILSDYGLSRDHTLRLKPKPPEPKWRPWKHGELKAGSIIRNSVGFQAIIVAIHAQDRKALFSNDTSLEWVTFETLFQFHEWLNQSGVWQKCGVQE